MQPESLGYQCCECHRLHDDDVAEGQPGPDDVARPLMALQPASRSTATATTAASESLASCLGRFAKARKLHTENLQHQPLPDKLGNAFYAAGSDYPIHGNRCDFATDNSSSRERRRRRRRICPETSRYGPALGCRKPKTYMDLAICWETPIDPLYEPPGPVHIDGSDGGPAPAIFTLVNQNSAAAPQVDCKDGTIPITDRSHHPHLHHHRGTPERLCCQTLGPGLMGGEEDEEQQQQQLQQLPGEASDDQLCKTLGSMCLTHRCDEHRHQLLQQQKKNKKKVVGFEARCRRSNLMRHSINESNSAGSPRIAKSAATATCLHRYQRFNTQRRNGLPPYRAQVPRPKTPYARRTFCIDSLAPPFSIVTGSRDADYPEHWRLASIYQQSYRHPGKLREGRTLLNYQRFD